MKAKTGLFTVIVLLFLAGGTGCEKEKKDDSLIIGEWTLLKVKQGFSQEISFEMGEVLCVFSSEKQLEVKTRLSNFPFLSKGIYNYSLIDERKISINGKTYEYSVSKKQLVLLDNAASDGDIIEFQRINL